MTLHCQNAIELLPWLFNGSLAEDERLEVTTHLRGCASCRREAARAAEVAGLVEGHPPPSLVVAWAAGETIPDAVEIERHLSSCPRCTEEVDLLKEGERLAAFVPGDRGGATAERRLVRWRSTAIVAAAAAVVVLAFGVASLFRQPTPDNVERAERLVSELDRLEQELAQAAARIADLESPRVNVSVVELLPVSLGLRSTATSTLIESSGPSITLILVPSGQLSGSYHLRIIAAGGEEVMSVDGLEPTQEGDLTLSLTPSSLPEGPLSIELVQEGQTEPVETYRVMMTRH